MKNEPKEGEVFSVEFIANKKNPKDNPICRVKGMIGFICNKDENEPIPGQVWAVSVKKVYSTYVIVDVLWIEKSFAQNEKDKLAKINSLRTKRERGKKQKKKFPYMSNKN